ncbi:MAG: hypothetical protein HW390_3390 [Candidatus Brocadiaceae bacterium]|nr:hypothetical protein [Candidatus Brocadiaceae bacterium]
MKNIPQKTTRRQPKIKTEMNGKGLTVYAGLLPVITFMVKLFFRNRVQEAVSRKRGANAQYQIVDIVQMVVIGLIAGATSLVQIVKVWSDEVLMQIAGPSRYNGRTYYEAGNPGECRGDDGDNP